MTPLVPLMLIGWIPLSVGFFFRFKAHKAVLLTLVGGWLFLPVAGYDIPGFPDYSKTTAVALGLLLGGCLSGKRRQAQFKWKIFDIPVIAFCLISFASVLNNQLGSYEGLSKVLFDIFFLGIPYMAGRVYFGSIDSLRDLCQAILVGGLIYVPLCLFEIRMSPQLTNMLYGFFPHSFLQHVRYGGYRPIVFMSHGLMVSLWMAVSSVIAFWYWRAGKMDHIKGVPMWLLVMVLIWTTTLCKSANGWAVLAMGCLFFYIYKYINSKMFFLILLMSITLYPVMRITGVVSAESVRDVVALVFDAERVDSMEIRLWQEDMFIEKTLEKPLTGWAGTKSGWPTREDGTTAVPMIDALWLIFFNSRGGLGLGSFFVLLLQGPYLVFRSSRSWRSLFEDHVMVPVLLSLVVVFFMMDALVNGMPNPVYFMASGALVSFHVRQKEKETGT